MYLYPRWIRFWHILNALFCLLLIITGLSLQYSDPDRYLIPFDKAVKIHNTGGILLSVSYLIFFVGNMFSSNRNHYKIQIRKLWVKMVRQLRFYFSGVLKGEKNPFTVTEEDKFNSLQKVSYVFIMYLCMPFIIITGWGLLFPDFTFNRILGPNGLLLTDLIHVISGFIISIFLIIHVYLCTLGPSPGSLFRSIISGYHERED